jgi:hypothetical protein
LDVARINAKATDLLQEVTKHGVYTAFYIDFEKGEVEYISPSYKFNINEETGELETEGESYKYEETINHYVIEWFNTNGIDYKTLPDTVRMINAKLPIEDSTYANCEYRIINGEKVWYNPPGVKNEVYITNERFDGKPVYVKTLIQDAIPKYVEESGEYVSCAIFAGQYFQGALSNIPSHANIINISGTYATETSKGILGDASTPISLTANNASLKVTNNLDVNINKFVVTIKFVQGE